MKVETISLVKKSAATLDLSESTLATHNSLPAYDQQERENVIALSKLMPLSEKDKAEGKTYSKEQLLDGING